MNRRRQHGGIFVWLFLLLLFAAGGVAYHFCDGPTVQNDEMAPTLRRSDILLSCRLQLCGPPERGDIVVFLAPEEAGVEVDTPLLRRVIGVPGDTVAVKKGVVYVNDHPVKGRDVGTVTLRRDIDEIKAAPVPLRMSLEVTGKHSYKVARELNDKPVGDRPAEKLEGAYFLMADQRTFIKDSRDFGTVSLHRIRSKVVRILDVSNDEPERVGPLP